MQTLDQWRREIEGLTKGRVITVPVATDRARNTLHLPPDFPGRAIVRDLMREESFVRQFVGAHALNVNFEGAAGKFHFILLNLALRDDWNGMEAGLLGHEYGHIWLNAMGYRSPVYSSANGDACAGVHAGDAVQHVLIRQETARRGFDSVGFWLKSLERWLAETAALQAPVRLAPCQRLQMIVLCLDAALGPGRSWVRFNEFQDRVRSLHPALVPVAEALEKALNGLDLWDRSAYEFALRQTIETMERVHAGQTR